MEFILKETNNLGHKGVSLETAAHGGQHFYALDCETGLVSILFNMPPSRFPFIEAAMSFAVFMRLPMINGRYGDGLRIEPDEYHLVCRLFYAMEEYYAK